MTVLSAIVNGIEYSLDDGTYSYWTVDDGLGMAQMHRITERGPLQHGDTDRGYRLDPRNIRLILDTLSDTQATFETNRLAMLSIFKPSTTPIILKLVMETRTYYLDVYYVASMSMPSNDRMGWNQIVIVDLVANDPTYYGESQAVSFVLGGETSNMMLVPTVIPMTIGASTLDADQSIIYNGTFLSYPTIRITGPITDPCITNNSTSEKLDFTGTTINSSDYYDIDCRYGYKTITDSTGANKISTLTNDSDLATFHIAPDFEAGGGINSFTVTGTSVTESTRVDMQYYERFIGI